MERQETPHLVALPLPAVQAAISLLNKSPQNLIFVSVPTGAKVRKNEGCCADSGPEHHSEVSLLSGRIRTSEGSGRQRCVDRRQLCRVWCLGAGGRKQRSSTSQSTDPPTCCATRRTLSSLFAPPHGRFGTTSQHDVGRGEDHCRALGGGNMMSTRIHQNYIPDSRDMTDLEEPFGPMFSRPMGNPFGNYKSMFIYMVTDTRARYWDGVIFMIKSYAPRSELSYACSRLCHYPDFVLVVVPQLLILDLHCLLVPRVRGSSRGLIGCFGSDCFGWNYMAPSILKQVFTTTYIQEKLPVPDSTEIAEDDASVRELGTIPADVSRVTVYERNDTSSDEMKKITYQLIPCMDDFKMQDFGIDPSMLCFKMRSQACWQTHEEMVRWKNMAWTIPVRCGSSGCRRCDNEKILCRSPCTIVPATIAESLARKKATSSTSGEGRCLSRFRKIDGLAQACFPCTPSEETTE